MSIRILPLRIQVVSDAIELCFSELEGVQHLNTYMIWILYWLALLTASTLTLYLCIDHLSHRELDQHNRELKHRIDQAELAYLRTKSTKSRIKSRPDL